MQSHRYSHPEGCPPGGGNVASCSAFDQLALPHLGLLHRVSLRILKNKEDAEDNVQNTLLRAFSRLPQFNGNSRFSTWLVRIAINEALMTLRSTRPMEAARLETTQNDAEVTDVLVRVADKRPSPEQQCAARETVEKALEGLPASVRDDFVLQKLEGWTNKELAVKRGTCVSKMKSRLFRARTILQKRARALRYV